jgi:hypothetical protein
MRHCPALLFVASFLIAALLPAPPASANTHIGSSGSSGGSEVDKDADCLRWEYVAPAGGSGSDRDAAVSADAAGDAGDAGAADSGGDAAPPPGATLVCVEHATLFGCECAFPASADGSGGGAIRGAGAGAALLIALGLARFRRARRRRGSSSRPSSSPRPRMTARGEQR